MTVERPTFRRGSYALLDEDHFLIIQHRALAQLPTVVALPATRQPIAHRPPLLIFDADNDLWIHTYAPATLWLDDLSPTDRTIHDEFMVGVEAGVAAVIDIAVIA